MQKAKKLCSLLSLFWVLGVGHRLAAGDIAVFADLGFSGDGQYYAFGQYGVNGENLTPWAELYLVNVAANDFTGDGRLSLKSPNKIEPGQDGSGALYQLVSKNQALASKYGINFLSQGIPLFISLENNNFARGIKDETIEFRDFDSGVTYTAALHPEFFGAGDSLKSSFRIDLARTKAGNTNFYRLGTPQVRRGKISSYTMKKVLVTEDRRSIVFVIEMTESKEPGSAPGIRYMVETHRFQD